MSGTSDPISRQTAIHTITNYNGIVDKSVAKRLLIQLPSVQPERKPGRWLIRKFGGDAQCSECGMYFRDAYDFETSDHYCRHCGVKMQGTALKLNG